jgi:hypothetical protein
MCDTFSNSTYTHMISTKAGYWMDGRLGFQDNVTFGTIGFFLALNELTFAL